MLSQWHVDQHYHGSPSITYHPSTTDSLLLGFGVEGGVFLSAHLAIGGEVRRPFQRAAISSFNSYFVSQGIQSQYRETSVFGTVRGVWRVGNRGRVGVVGGGGLLIGNSSEVVITTTGISPFSTTEQHVRQVTRSFFGTMFGGEFAIVVNRRISIVPDARLYIVKRGEVLKSDNPGAYLGLPINLFQALIGVRIGL